MVSAICSLYKNEDLVGECLTSPLKGYHGFFAKKLEDSRSLSYTAWLITNVVTGIFAYPGLGALAGLGILVKILSFPCVWSHNEAQKARITSINSGIKNTVFFGRSDLEVQGGHETKLQNFEISRENVDEMCQTIKQQIDLLSWQWKKVYVNTHGAITSSSESRFIVDLMVCGTSA